MRKLLLALVAVGAVVVVAAIGTGTASTSATTRQVTVPESDRFAPFALTIRVGDTVQWINDDEDDHTVVSDDPFDTSGPRGVNALFAADGGTYSIKFTHPGTFVYYCRFHARLDEFHQPIAPGPDGGIQDAHGNFGT